MSGEGGGACYANTTRRNDGGSGSYPRYTLAWFEKADPTIGSPADEDPVFGTMSATTSGGSNAKFIAGILNAALPSDEWTTDLTNLSAGIVVKADRVTVKPGVVLDPTTTTLAPDVKGSLMYDSGSDELKYWDGAWQIVSAGGLSSHALDGIYHSATGLTVGWVLSADSVSTFSWKAPAGGSDDDAIHDNVANEITAITAKTSLGSTDEFILEDGGASFVKKAVTFANIESSISLANLGTRTHASLSDAPSDAHHVAFVLADFTTAFAAESLANLATRNHGSLSDAPTDVHHTEVHVLATTGPHSGDLPLTDLAVGSQGSIIYRDGTDWAELGLGTNTYVLKSGATDVAWGQVDYSELVGTQPAPVAHVLATTGPHSGTLPWSDLDLTSSSLADLSTRTHGNLSDAPTDAHHVKVHALVDATNHPESGLTTGHFLKATGTTTYAFGAHGLTASDVSAAADPHGEAAHSGDVIPNSDQSFAGTLAMTPVDTTGSLFTITSTASLTGNMQPVVFDFSGMTLGGNNIDGLTISMPATYGAGSERAVYVSGDGRSVTLCSDTHSIETSGHVSVGGELQTGNILTIGTIGAGASDYDKFLVSDSGVVKFRTGAELAGDIGAAAVPLALTDLASYVQGSIIKGGGADWEALAAGTEDYVLKMGASEPAWGQVDYSELVGTQPAPVAHVLATSGPHSGSLPITDLASYAQGALIKGASSDWVALAPGIQNTVLKMGAAEPQWGPVNYTELGGSQPAPINHNLVDTTKHPVTGLTPGDYLKALTSTTYGFAAPPTGVFPQPYIQKDGVIWRPDLTTWSDDEHPDFVTIAPGGYELATSAYQFCKTDYGVYYPSGYDSASFRYWHDDNAAGPQWMLHLPFVAGGSWEIRWRWRRDSGDELLRGHQYSIYGWFWDETDSKMVRKRMCLIDTTTSGQYDVKWETGLTVRDSLTYSTDTWYDWRFQFVGSKGPSAANCGQGRSSLIASSGASWQTSWSSWYDFIDTDGTDIRYTFLCLAYIVVGYNNQSYETLQWMDDLEVLHCDYALGW